jgi:hypothetical protein
MATLGIIHGGAQNEPRTNTFYLSRSDYNSLADMGQFNTYRYVNSNNIIEAGRELVYLGGKPSGEILQPGYSVHGHLNFGTTYKSITYFCTDHALTLQEYFGQVPQQVCIQLFANPNVKPNIYSGPGTNIPHPLYESHNVAGEMTGNYGVNPDWDTSKPRAWIKLQTDSFTGKMDNLCGYGDNYLVWNCNTKYSISIRCFGFYGIKAPYPTI